MSLHKEIEFEGVAAHYDRARALISAAVTGKIDVRGLTYVEAA